MRERRYGPRVPVDAGATVWTGSREIRCQVVNLSAGGMAVETAAGAELGRFVRIGMRLGPDLRIDVDAIVLRRERHGDRTRWGVELHQVPPNVLSRISEFVSERLQSAPTPAYATPRADLDGDREHRDLIDAAVRSLG